MPRRAPARSAALSNDDAHLASSSAPNDPPSLPQDLLILRTQWKWAAFSQFFFTFSQLLAMDDVTLNNVEDDLVHGLNLYLPRIIIRLLFTLTYDRKINLNNWQSALRKQYNKRDPDKNPIGPEPRKDNASSRYTSVIEESTSPEPQTEEPDASAGDADRSSVASRNEEQDEGADVKAEQDAFETLPREQKETDQDENGEQQETKDWLTLSMLEKLDSLHLLTEWQFQNPTRLRHLMKTDDEQASWRIEPIGYDAKKNAYWLIGADRLWIQRAIPKPPRPTPNKTNLKRKRGVAESSQPAKSARASASNKRPRLQASSKTSAIPESPASGRRGRAAKAQANLKLDVQAKQLAELNRQAAALARRGAPSVRSSRRQQASPATPPKTSTSRPARGGTRSRALGTRISARLRGAEDEEEWQEIPEEWLNDGNLSNKEIVKGKGKGKGRSTGLESDKSSVSDLTELSELSSEEEEEADEKADTEEKEYAEEKEDTDEEKEESLEPEPEPAEEVKVETTENFVEWETICVTLYEWEHIAERWQNVTHYAEKALYKVLTKEIVPIVTEELREIENKRQMEEAVVHRKRSSRLAIKEIEKEEAREAARRRAEEGEKMGRQRRAEARAQREEAERTRRELAREQRRKEREAKEKAEEEEEEEEERKKQEENQQVEEEAASEPTQGRRSRKRASGSAINGWSNGYSHTTSKANDWEVDCEICQRRGTNIDGDKPLMCCGICTKWQHITCHDRADQLAGRPRRDWKKVDFYCLRCRQRAPINGTGGHHQESIALHSPNPHPSMRMPSTSGNGMSAISSYNHITYGQGSPSHHMNNGYGTGKGYATVSDLRSSVSLSQIPAAGYSTSSATPSTKQITFSHYQPQQHDFSSQTTRAPLRQQTSYGSSSSQIQAYGQQPQSAHSQFVQHYQSTPVDTQTQSYSRPLPSPSWNGNTTQTMGYPSFTSYAASAERSSAAATQHPIQNLSHGQSQPYSSQQWNSYTQGGNIPYSSYHHSS
ncbi:hypothetical protein VKT23_011309 [Stygiomarasmius scandens]|uniref:PHD-type domain-containing protein n=1 Tax=Marasmiellus scandens TaxID=2682957 RepID=A0ABR1JDR4_9AGAR